MQNQTIKSENVPEAIGPYSIGVRSGQFVFTAGQLGIDVKTGEFVSGGIKAQTRKALENLSAVLEAAAGSVGDVVKTTVFLRDMDEFAQMNAVYQEFFQENYPARSAVQVARLPKDADVEIEAIAIIRQARDET